MTERGSMAAAARVRRIVRHLTAIDSHPATVALTPTAAVRVRRIVRQLEGGRR